MFVWIETFFCRENLEFGWNYFLSFIVKKSFNPWENGWHNDKNNDVADQWNGLLKWMWGGDRESWWWPSKCRWLVSLVHIHCHVCLEPKLCHHITVCAKITAFSAILCCLASQSEASAFVQSCLASFIKISNIYLNLNITSYLMLINNNVVRGYFSHLTRQKKSLRIFLQTGLNPNWIALTLLQRMWPVAALC